MKRLYKCPVCGLKNIEGDLEKVQQGGCCLVIVLSVILLIVLAVVTGGIGGLLGLFFIPCSLYKYFGNREMCCPKCRSTHLVIQELEEDEENSSCRHYRRNQWYDQQ